jgi:hypothetical protein
MPPPGVAESGELSMIDQAWLKQLRFELGEGYRLDGVYVGGTNAALKIIYPDGNEFALRIPRKLFEFACYIHEVPNWLVPNPQYDVDRLNRKLGNLLGDTELHLIVGKYDLLFYSILESGYEAGITKLDSFMADSEEANRIWRFIIQTPSISYRLDEYATGTDKRRRCWAEQALIEIRGLGPADPGLSPQTLFDNPLVVWGAAVSEGFFTKAELPHAVSAVEQQLLSLPEERLQIFLWQMHALMVMLHSIEGMPAPTGIAVFCDATGFFPTQFATEEERSAPDHFGAVLDAIKRFDR